jgi:hypothetical protein
MRYEVSLFSYDTDVYVQILELTHMREGGNDVEEDTGYFCKSLMSKMLLCLSRRVRSLSIRSGGRRTEDGYFLGSS